MPVTMTTSVCFSAVVFVTVISVATAFDPVTVISTAAAAISAGSSLAGTTMSGLMSTGYAVNCGIEVENWTRFSLTLPEVTIGDGAVTVPPQAILPSKREAMVAHKTSATAQGSYGTVSWLVAGKNRRLVVMWSAPYDFNLYSNWLAVGFTAVGVTTHSSSWFDQMYHGHSTPQLGFTRKEYNWQVSSAVYNDTELEIIGTMGTSHQAQVKITVLALNKDDLAAPVKALLQQKK